MKLVNKKFFTTAAVLVVFICSVFGQAASNTLAESESVTTAELKSLTAETSHSATTLSPSPQLAMSTSNYPVTAGDVYTLAFNANATPITYTIPVDTTYKIRVANMGILDVRGLTYLQLKKQVEEVVTKNYPMSGVQFVLLTPAVFSVTIKGEVKQTEIRQAWALTRLSSVIAGTFTGYSSNRDVLVTSSNGVKRTYDLFKSARDGDISQDPYIRPGDVVTINRIKRKVTISGAVERPGTYELMKNENLKTLVEYYGGGLTDFADTTRISLSRYLDADDECGTKYYLDGNAIKSDYKLENKDQISIGSNTSLKPYITIEGIIRTGRDKDQNEDPAPNATSKVSITFLPGDNYAEIVREQRGLLTIYSDLQNAYIERNEEKIPMNLEEILYDASFKSEYYAEKGDKLVIPFMQLTQKVHIRGEVKHSFERNAWPLLRISDLLDGDLLTPYSSTRIVQVTSIEGVTTTYDLFQARRFGDLSQNPYVRAGETVTIQRFDRKVSIDGSVERPGTYELFENENLKDLVEYYAGGLTDFADTSRISLSRYLQADDECGTKYYIDGDAITDNYKLENKDHIHIGSNTALLPYITIEGIIRISKDTDGEDDPAPNATSKVSIKFLPGDNYAEIVREQRGLLTIYSDLQNAYIERNDEKLLINLEDILFDESFKSEYYAEKGDKLVVPFLQLTQKVHVRGEVKHSVERNAWPLLRISDILDSDILTPFSSTRIVEVTSIEGVTTTYDLFQARRFGDLDQNPYVRAGETVTVKRFDRKVKITGAVERPGTYELQENEQLKELVEYYGGGITDFADPTRIELTRYLSNDEHFDESGEKIYLSKDTLTNNLQLYNHDAVDIADVLELKPVMFMEGALYTTDTDSPNASKRVSMRFTTNENYAFLIRRNRSMFSTVSDISNAYIIRGKKTIPIDLSKALYDKSYYCEEVVQPDDVLMVPFKQYFVTVAGAVNAPGRYPYIPDRDWEYYIALAGGFIPSKNAHDAVTIFDMNGKKHSKRDPITPETVITAKSNSFTYYFNQYSGVVTTMFSLAATLIAIIAALP